MSTKEILSQEEIDALLSSVEEGAVPVSNSGAASSGEAQRVDFSNQNLLLSTGIPALNVAYERFSEHFCDSVFNTLRCNCEVNFAGTRVTSFVDYLNGMETPTFINYVHLKPMAGLAMAVFDLSFVRGAVDRFYGGSIGSPASEQKTAPSHAEIRMGKMLLAKAFADLQRSMSSVLAIEAELVQSETNPDFAHLLNPSEPLMLNTFEVRFDNTEGQFQLAIPHTMIEPYRERLVNTYRMEAPTTNNPWAPIIVDEVQSAEVSLSSILGEAQLTVREILDLNPGDVIPLKVADAVTLYAEGIPVFSGTFGNYNGKQAVKVIRKLGPASGTG